MAISFRILLMALGISSVGLTACSDSAEPTPAATSVKFQDAAGSFTPVAALTKITATPVGGGTVSVATMTTTGTYRFQALPLGKYTLACTPAAGYAAPADQLLTIQASSAAVIPEITVLTERTALLTGRRWKVTSNVSRNITAGTSIDYLAMDPACARDNFLQFDVDYTLFVDEGPVKCAESNPQVFNYNWAFEKNETQLRFIYPGGTSAVGDIVQLTATSIQLRNSRTSEGQDFVQTITYAAL